MLYEVITHLLKGIDSRFCPELHETPPHLAEAHMGQILGPLEVGDRYPAGIGIHVRNDDLAFLTKDLVGLGGDRTVGGLDDQVGLV